MSTASDPARIPDGSQGIAADPGAPCIPSDVQFTTQSKRSRLAPGLLTTTSAPAAATSRASFSALSGERLLISMRNARASASAKAMPRAPPPAPTRRNDFPDWSKAVEGDNIRINAICLGATDSHMLRGFTGEARLTPELIASWMKPADVAQVMIDLIKDGRRTAHNIPVWVRDPVVLTPTTDDFSLRIGVMKSAFDV
jgi:hypothetical protein